MRNVYVRGLAIFQTVEEELVTTNPEQYWHDPSLHPLGWRNVLVGGACLTLVYNDPPKLPWRAVATKPLLNDINMSFSVAARIIRPHDGGADRFSL